MRLNHVTLIVSRLDRSRSFYARLGLRLIVIEEPRYARFQCPDGDATLSLEVTGADPSTTGTQVYFECADLDAVCASLRADGIVFLQHPTDMDYLWREAHLRDPDGHDIRLYHAGQNRLHPPWRIDA